MAAIYLPWFPFRQYSISSIAVDWSFISAIVCQVLCPVLLLVRYTCTKYFPFSGFTCANSLVLPKINCRLVIIVSFKKLFIFIFLLQRYNNYLKYASKIKEKCKAYLRKLQFSFLPLSKSRFCNLTVCNPLPDAAVARAAQYAPWTIIMRRHTKSPPTNLDKDT